MHEHVWIGYPADTLMVICDCGEMARIASLLRETARVAEMKAKREVYASCLKQHWLTPRARKLVNDYMVGRSWHRGSKEPESVPLLLV